MRQTGLGKGLSALIPPTPAPVAAAPASLDAPAPAGAILTEVLVSEVRANPNQPRQQFDDASLDSLASSIKSLGVLQPILVRRLSSPAGGTTYELIAGERRLRAAKRLGLASIPAIVRTIDDQASVEQAVVENLHREDLNPLEEAAAYQQLLDEFGLTHDAVAQRVGKSRAAISNAIRLFQLPPAVQKLVRDQALTAGHARTLLGLNDAHAMVAMAEQIVVEGWSVRTAEEAVRAASQPTATSTGGGSASIAPMVAGKTLREPGLLEVESLLSDLLDTRVTIDMGAKRGKVGIEFADLADLERIYRIISTSPELRTDD